MRLLILGDMEGTCGISRWGHVLVTEPLYEEGRRLYTGDLSAAVRGAKKAGVDDIIVVDTHGAGGDRSFNNVVRESLEEGCRYLSQYKWFDFETLLAEGCDAAMLVGIHAKSGTPDGVLSHTASAESWQDCRIDGKSVGETAILSALCSHYNCPVIMITGDEAVCREAEQLITPPPVTVPLKRGLGRYSAVHMHPEAAHRLIEDKTVEALGNISSIGLYRPSEPCTVEVDFSTPEAAQGYVKAGIAEPVGERGIRVTARDWREAFRNV